MPISQRDIKEFERLALALASYARELRQRCPAANLYLAEDTLHLMEGPSHDERGRPQQQNSKASVWLSGAGGGDW